MQKLISLMLVFCFGIIALSSCNQGSPEETTETAKITEQEEILQNGALYTIESAKSSHAMTVYQFGIADKADIVLEKYDKDLSQLWRALSGGNGEYIFENMSSGLFMSVMKNSDTDGARLCGYVYGEAGKTPVWSLEALGDNKYLIRNISSGKYASIKESAADEAVYAEQREADGSDSQQWVLTKRSDGNGKYPRVLILSGDKGTPTSTPEIIKQNGVYYCYNMTGPIWIKTSTDLKSWTKVKTAFPSKPSWIGKLTEGTGVWAPGVYKIGEKYYLYYAVSSSGSQNSAIGMASNATLDFSDPEYGWVDKGIVLSSNSQSGYNAIDPNVFVEEDGSAYLAFGSYWGGIFMYELDENTGMLDKNSQNVWNLGYDPNRFGLEAPYLIKKDGWYYLFVARGSLSKGYYWAVARSESLYGPYVDKNGRFAMSGNFTRLTDYKDGIEAVAHAQIFLDDDGQYYLVGESWIDRDAENRVMQLHISTIVWTQDGWPVTALDKDVLGTLGE